jgi:hypothetical protein
MNRADAPAAGAESRQEWRPGPEDKSRVHQVLGEIFRQAANLPHPCFTAQTITGVFWVAHLWYARENPDYLTLWPLIRRPWGAELTGAEHFLAALVEDGVALVEARDRGPFQQLTYRGTGKPVAPEAPARVKEAVAKALRFVMEFPLVMPMPWAAGWPAVLSRVWRETPDGEEMNVHLDLIPENVYREQQQTLEAALKGCEDLFT